MTIGFHAPASDALWRLLDDVGIDPGPEFDAVGIDRASMIDCNARLSFPSIVRLWVRVERLVDDPCIGLRVGRYLQPSHVGALGHAWLASTTLRSGLQRLSRYSRMVNDHRGLGFVESRDGAGVVLSNDERDAELLSADELATARGTRTDSLLSSLDAMCRWRLADEYRPLRLELRRPRPDHAECYTRHFGCEVLFDAPCDSYHIGRAMADRPLAGGDPQLALLDEEYMRKRLAELDRGDLRARVQAVVLTELPSGTVRMAQVARQLHLSARTLQRRLGDLGTSFSELMDQTRRELALEMLHDRRRSLTEIAFSTGFSSLSSFSAAVRHWTGQAPSRVREGLA